MDKAFLNKYKDQLEWIRKKKLLTMAKMSQEVGISHPVYSNFVRFPERHLRLKTLRIIKCYVDWQLEIIGDKYGE